MTTQHDPTPDEALGGGDTAPDESTVIPPPDVTDEAPDAGEAGEASQGEPVGSGVQAAAGSEDAVGEVPESEHTGSEAPAAGGVPDTTGETLLVDRGRHWADRWDEIQTAFVDEPRQSVARADTLVDEVVNELTAVLGRERSRLETEWNAGREPSTEDLRVALQHYRSFFHRLLSVT